MKAMNSIAVLEYDNKSKNMIAPLLDTVTLIKVIGSFHIVTRPIKKRKD